MRNPFSRSSVGTLGRSVTAACVAVALTAIAGPSDATAQEAQRKAAPQEEKTDVAEPSAEERQKAEQRTTRQEQAREKRKDDRQSRRGERDSKTRAELGVILAPGEKGIRIVRVRPDGPADEAGLERGDVLTAVDGQKLSKPRAAIEHLATHQPGDECKIEYLRDGETHTAEVTLGKSRVLAMPELPFEARARETAWLGALLFEDRGEGAMVATVFPTGPAQQAGLRRGDTIVRASDEEIEGPEDLEEVLKETDPDETIPLAVHRDGEEMTMDVKLGRHVVVQLVPRDRDGRDEESDERESFGWDDFADDMDEPDHFIEAHEEMFRMHEDLQDEVRDLRDELRDLRHEMRRLRDDGARSRGRGQRDSDSPRPQRQRTEV